MNSEGDAELEKSTMNYQHTRHILISTPAHTLRFTSCQERIVEELDISVWCFYTKHE